MDEEELAALEEDSVEPLPLAPEANEANEADEVTLADLDAELLSADVLGELTKEELAALAEDSLEDDEEVDLAALEAELLSADVLDDLSDEELAALAEDSAETLPAVEESEPDGAELAALEEELLSADVLEDLAPEESAAIEADELSPEPQSFEEKPDPESAVSSETEPSAALEEALFGPEEEPMEAAELTTELEEPIEEPAAPEPPREELLGPEEGELLGTPSVEDPIDDLFSGPAPLDPIDDDFFSGPSLAEEPSAVGPGPAELEAATASAEEEEADELLEDLAAPLEEEPETLETPTREYRSTILAALRQVKTQEDESATRADVLSVLEKAVPKEMRSGVAERRRLVRLSCEYEVNCYQGNQIFHATIRDISLGGMKIEVSRELEAMSLLEISNPNRTEDDADERITAQVRWYRVNPSGVAEAGLQFVDPPDVLGRSWIVSLLNRVGMQSQVFNQRKYTRAVADFDVELEDSEGELHWARCLDLGLGGALVLVPLESDLREGDEVLFRSHSFGVHGLLEAPSKVVKLKSQDGESGTYALEFGGLSPEMTKLLGRYIVDLLKLGRGTRER